MLPHWVYTLINAVQAYEDEHRDYVGTRFDEVLLPIPAEERHAAKVLAAYGHERAKLTTSQHLFAAAIIRAVAEWDVRHLNKPERLRVCRVDLERFQLEEGMTFCGLPVVVAKHVPPGKVSIEGADAAYEADLPVQFTEP